MIYFFRAISNESDDFLIDIAIDSGSRFLDLHNFIQQRLDYDNTQMASFFVTDDEWNKEQEITLIDMMEEASGCLVMDKVALEDLVRDKKQRLLYAFDLFAERVLFMELTQIDEGSLKQPVCTRQEGTPPQQFLEEGFSLDSFEEEELYNDELDDFYNTDDEFPDQYSDEDLDPDNYY